ncbi:TlpA family protein disulfide reductase [Aquabacterium sp.]|uniref:TlpA family protein disulfide reductase n=1 Tax=Aquabacterium sp. TaxID=1872578 RepID=UPI002C159BD7|nr:TlpA disulfide reductase family protein [Aquabacterium sp.]HSW03352.1 TlpA disulfide reductase family protein [Aquabacterium sp.]
MSEPAALPTRRACLAAALRLGAGLPGLPLAAGLQLSHAATPGDTAPALALLTTAGEAVLPGTGLPRWRALYLDFWASWCGPCRQSFPWMNQLHDQHQAAGLRVVGINLDARPEDAQDFLKQLPPRFAIAFDAAAASARDFGVKAMPSSFLIAPDRRVLLAHRGFRNEQRAELERRIVAALS